jgi:hypothetical protein
MQLSGGFPEIELLADNDVRLRSFACLGISPQWTIFDRRDAQNWAISAGGKGLFVEVVRSAYLM